MRAVGIHLEVAHRTRYRGRYLLQRYSQCATRKCTMRLNQLSRRCLLLCVWLNASLHFAAGQKHEFSNRFEGSYQNQGNTDLDIIGVLRSPISFNSPSTLSVKLFFPTTGLATDKVLVEAQEITQSRNYFMQSKSFSVRTADWNAFTPWPSSDVIDSLGVAPQNLAVTASYIDQSGTRVLPSCRCKYWRRSSPEHLHNPV